MNTDRLRIYGYFTDVAQTVPAFDPGLSVACPICAMTLNPVNVRTISLIVPGDTRSYFYRVHRSCHEPLSEAERVRVDGLLIDAIYSTRMTNEKDRALALSIPLGVSCVCDIAHAGSICDKHQRIAAALATVRADERDAAFKEALEILNEFGRELRKADFLARLEAVAKATKYAELDRVLAEAAIEDPIGVRLTELALEQMDAEDKRATEK